MKREGAMGENELWATIDLMGHAQTAGRISRPQDWGGLLRVDVPLDGDTYRTEYYGMQAIYSIRLVSEEIARSYARPVQASLAYDAPIVTREQHQAAMRQATESVDHLRGRIRVLEGRLTAVRGLPEPSEEPSDEG
jgi:hypothetical protein